MRVFDKATGKWWIITYNGQDYDLISLSPEGIETFECSGSVAYLCISREIRMTKDRVRDVSKSLRSLVPAN